MSATTNVTSMHFDRTIRDLETKLARQRGAVASTEEMIEAVKALKKQTDDESAQKREQIDAAKANNTRK